MKCLKSLSASLIAFAMLKALIYCDAERTDMMPARGCSDDDARLLFEDHNEQNRV